MNLSELIDTHRGGRSYSELSRACGGSPSDKRLQQLVRGEIKNFPDPDTVRALARGLKVSQAAVVLAAAESLGLDVRTSLPRLVDLLPAKASELSEEQAAAVAHLVGAFVEPKIDFAWKTDTEVVVAEAKTSPPGFDARRQAMVLTDMLVDRLEKEDHDPEWIKAEAFEYVQRELIATEDLDRVFTAADRAAERKALKAARTAPSTGRAQRAQQDADAELA